LIPIVAGSLGDHRAESITHLAVDCGNVGYHLSNDQAIWVEVKAVTQ